MLKKLLLGALIMTNACFFAADASAAVKLGETAPSFTATDTKGQSVSLEALKGKTVVLEWTNYGCPFVRKHYDTQNMQALQKKYAADDLVWIGVMSSAESKEGFYKTNEEAQKAADGKKAYYSHLIRDADGKIGKMYGAATTPHMFIIDKDGALVYQGAIDDTPSADKATVETAKNYVSAALDEIKAGKKVSVSETKPYGCSVKY